MAHPCQNERQTATLVCSPNGRIDGRMISGAGARDAPPAARSRGDIAFLGLALIWP